MERRHTCLIYEGEASRPLPVLAPALEQGLREGYRCVYLGEPGLLSLAAGALEARGVEVAAHVSRGALVLSSERPHLGHGGFRPEAMIGALEQMVDRAVADGYAGLWATGDMAWELGGSADSDALLDYEARLDALFGRKPINGICQYRLGSLAPRALGHALRTHGGVYVGERLNRHNLFYLPPEALDGSEAGRDKQGEWMWRQMSRVTAAENERDRALEELSRAKTELERRVAERTEELRSFTYAAAHDLKAPLRSIDGFAQLIELRHLAALPPEARELFAHVRGGAKKIGDLIDGLLALSRLSTSDLHLGPVDLSALALATMRRLQAGEPRRKAVVTIQPGLVARGDARLLAAALENLLGNAWKFTAGRDTAHIEFGATQREGRRVYAVRDDGAGFDAAGQSERLFQPFQRFHSQREFAGNGLGLTIVRRVVERHGGRIQAESVPGKGAVFSFTLAAA